MAAGATQILMRPSLAVVIGLKEAAQVLLNGVHILHDAGMNAELLAGVHAATAQDAADAQLLPWRR